LIRPGGERYTPSCIESGADPQPAGGTRLHERSAMPQEVERWALSKDHARVVCTERTTPSHIELHVTWANLPLASRRCVNDKDAARWADRMRLAWEATGWRAR
jgi:hypothetical protein